MNKQVGAISAAFMTVLVVLGLVVTLAGIGLVSYISAANYGNKAEKQLDAVWVDNQNVLAQYTLKVQEAAQIPEMYKNDLKEVVTAALQGRYGPDGSKGVFQWLKEANIPFDNKVYTQMMQIIESGRNEFKREQTKMIDVKRSYETELGYVWRGFWLRMAGYPKIDLAKYKPVLAADTAQAFEKGQQAPLQLRSK